MGSNCFFSFKFLLFILFSCFLLHVHSNLSSSNPNTREALEIVVGGIVIGGGGVRGGGGGGGSGSEGGSRGGGAGAGAEVSSRCGCAPKPSFPPKPESPPPQQPEAPPPRPPVLPPPLVFIDVRLSVVYPVIQKFKNIITSDPLGITKTWVGADICSYKGIFCTNPPDNESATAVASVDFNGFHLEAPSINEFLNQLPDLAIFHANSNNFSGTLSPDISKLPYFYELDLSNNNFSGPFPTAVLGLTNATFLDLRFNSFTGSVPPELFILNLEILFINNNNFIQKLPENLGTSPVLVLTLANNNFTGPIPKSIGKANATLLEILFLNNQLSGCLPYEIGYLKNVTVFDAGYNQLTGPIPCSFGCLGTVEILNFAGNRLYGQVPEVVCALGSLANLSLSDNYFTKVGPTCQSLINSGVLDLRNNCVHNLPSQRATAECDLFFERVKLCPNTDYIPCMLPGSQSVGRHNGGRSGHEKSFSSFKKKKVASHSPSYAALLKHHRL